MATTNKSLAQPANDSDIDVWDVPLNGNATIIDTALGGLTTLNVTSVSGIIALNLTQYTPCGLLVTGTLTANVNYQIPSGVGGFWFPLNSTTGAFSVTFSSAGGGTSVVLPQGTGAAIVSDGTNVRLIDTIPAIAGGSPTQVQFNNAGTLAGSANLTFAPAGAGALVLGGTLSVGGALTLLGSLGTNASVTTLGLPIVAGAQTTPVATAFSATAMVVNCALSNVFATVFTANVTTAPSLTNPGDGQTVNWFITQDATGSRTMTWPASFRWPGGVKGILSTAGNATDLLVATYRAATGVWYATLLNGFA